MPQGYFMGYLGADGGIQAPVSKSPRDMFVQIARAPTGDKADKKTITGLTWGDENIILPRRMTLREAANHFLEGEGRDKLAPIQTQVLEVAKAQAAAERPDRATQVMAALEPAAQGVVDVSRYPGRAARGTTAAILTLNPEYARRGIAGKDVDLSAEHIAVRAVSGLGEILPYAVLQGPVGLARAGMPIGAALAMAAPEADRQAEIAARGGSAAEGAALVAFNAGVGALSSVLANAGATQAAKALQSEKGLATREALGFAMRANKSGTKVKAGRYSEVANRIGEATGAAIGGELGVAPMTVAEMLRAQQDVLNYEVEKQRAELAGEAFIAERPKGPTDVLIENLVMGLAFGALDLMSRSRTGARDRASMDVDVAPVTQATQEGKALQEIMGDRKRHNEASVLSRQIIAKELAGPSKDSPLLMSPTVRRFLTQDVPAPQQGPLARGSGRQALRQFESVIPAFESAPTAQLQADRSFELPPGPMSPEQSLAPFADVSPRLTPKGRDIQLKGKKKTRRVEDAPVPETIEDLESMSDGAIAALPFDRLLEIEDIEVGQAAMERQAALLGQIADEIAPAPTRAEESVPTPEAPEAPEQRVPLQGRAHRNEGEPPATHEFEHITDDASAQKHRDELVAHAESLGNYDEIVEQLRRTYVEIDDPYRDVEISRLAEKAGVPLKDARAVIIKAALDQDKSLFVSEGDWSMSPDWVRQGVVWSPGGRGTHGPKHFLKVRFDEVEPQVKPEPRGSDSSAAPTPARQQEPPPPPPTAPPPPRISPEAPQPPEPPRDPSSLSDDEVLALQPAAIKAIRQADPEAGRELFRRRQNLEQKVAAEEQQRKMRSATTKAAEPETVDVDAIPEDAPTAGSAREKVRKELEANLRKAGVPDSLRGDAPLGIVSGLVDLQAIKNALLKIPRNAWRLSLSSRIGQDARYEAQRAKAPVHPTEAALRLEAAGKAFARFRNPKRKSVGRQAALRALDDATNDPTAGPLIERVMRGDGRYEAAVSGKSHGEQQRAAQRDLAALGRATSQEFAGAVGKLREHIDDLTRVLEQTDLVDASTSAVLRGNTGIYMTRAYLARETSMPWQNYIRRYGGDKDHGKRAEFRKFLKASFPKVESDGALDRLEMDFITGRKDGKAVGNFLSASARVDDDMLKRRSAWLEDNPIVREALGEITDPIKAYEVSVAKLAGSIARDKFYEKVRPIGIRQGWIKVGEQAGPVGFEKMPEEGYGALSQPNTWIKSSAKREIEDILMGPQSIFGKQESGLGLFAARLARAWAQGVMVPKKAKTSYNPLGYVRNFTGGGLLSVGNNHFSNLAKHGKTAWEIMKDPKHPLRARLVSLGLWHGDIRSQEIARDARDAESFMDDLFGGKVAYEAMKRFDRGAGQAYQAPDVFWKINGWLHEIDSLKRKGIQAGNQKALEEIAAKRISNLYPNYDALPPIIRGIRRMPMGTFASFPAEMARNAGWNLKYALQDAAEAVDYSKQGDSAKAKAYMQEALMKMIGLGVASTGIQMAIDAISGHAAGVSAEYKRAYRALMPSWNENSYFLWSPNYKDSIKNHNDIGHIPLNYLDPYETVREMSIGAAATLLGSIANRNEQGEVEFTPGKFLPELPNRFGRALDTIARPYLSADLFFKAVVEPAINKQGDNLYFTEYGTDKAYPITYYSTGTGPFAALSGTAVAGLRRDDLREHSWEMMRPGAFTIGKGIQDAGRLRPEDAAMIVGLKPTRVTPEVLKYSVSALAREKSAAEADVRNYIRDSDGNPDPDRLATLYLESEQKRYRAFMKAREVYTALKDVGFAPYKINQELLKVARDRKTAEDIVSGRFSFYTPSEAWLSKLPRQSVQALVQAVRLQRARIQRDRSVLE